MMTGHLKRRETFVAVVYFLINAEVSIPTGDEKYRDDSVIV
jgi:hypothetical protein